MNSGSNELVRLGVFNCAVPAEGVNELQFLAGRHPDEAGAGAADPGTVTESMLAKYAAGRAVVVEFHEDLPRDVG